MTVPEQQQGKCPQNSKIRDSKDARDPEPSLVAVVAGEGIGTASGSSLSL